MDTLITSLTGAGDFVVTMATKVITLVTGQPLLLIPTAIGLFGSGVVLFKRLKRG